MKNQSLIERLSEIDREATEKIKAYERSYFLRTRKSFERSQKNSEVQAIAHEIWRSLSKRHRFYFFTKLRHRRSDRMRYPKQFIDTKAPWWIEEIASIVLFVRAREATRHLGTLTAEKLKRGRPKLFSAEDLGLIALVCSQVSAITGRDPRPGHASHKSPLNALVRNVLGVAGHRGARWSQGALTRAIRAGQKDGHQSIFD